MSFIVIDRRPLPHVYIAGHRTHHGMVGLILALLGAIAMWDDRKDFPWLRDI